MNFESGPVDGLRNGSDYGPSGRADLDAAGPSVTLAAVVAVQRRPWRHA
jgi:hypothetical protein